MLCYRSSPRNSFVVALYTIQLMLFFKATDYFFKTHFCSSVFSVGMTRMACHNFFDTAFLKVLFCPPWIRVILREKPSKYLTYGVKTQCATSSLEVKNLILKEKLPVITGLWYVLEYILISCSISSNNNFQKYRPSFSLALNSCQLCRELDCNHTSFAESACPVLKSAKVNSFRLKEICWLSAGLAGCTAAQLNLQLNKVLFYVGLVRSSRILPWNK